ncbi:MAG: hypothetical protein WCL02_01545 [bacterium]
MAKKKKFVRSIGSEDPKKLQPSDFRFGLVDDDGSSMPEIVSQCSGPDLDGLSDDQKPPKINLTPDEAFLEPIILQGNIKKKLCKLMQKAGYGVDPKKEFYLQTKLTDPNFHPNDYFHLEGPSELNFTHLLTTCEGVFLLRNLVDSPIDNNAALKAVQQHCEDNRITHLSDEDVLPDLFFMKENNIPELPQEVAHELIESEETEEIEIVNHFSDMKVSEVIKLFQNRCCSHPKKKICHKRHYLMGIGEVIINEKEYSGLHIYLAPDIHYEQLGDLSDKIHDDLYLLFQTEKNIPGIQHIRNKYAHGYLKEFSLLLDQITS